MNQRSDIDRVLQVWMTDGPTAIPDRVVDVVAARIGVQRQRRTWPFQGRTNVTPLKLAAGLAAAIIVAVVGYNLLPASGPGGPRPTQSPAPSSSASQALTSPSPTEIACEDGLAGCAGALEAGAHETVHFAPALAYMTPSGWANRIDLSTLVALTPDLPGTADLILIWSAVVPAEKTETCELRAKPGAGSTVDAWVEYLTSHPGLDAGNVQSLTLNGAQAKSVDVRSFGGWTSPCADDRANFNVPLIKTPNGAPGDGYGVAIGAEARLYLVDVGGTTVVITVYSYGGTAEAFATAVALAEPVVTSFEFATP